MAGGRVECFGKPDGTCVKRMSLPHPHPACLDDEALLRQCTVRTGRSGGPGGQHRNKVETHVQLTHVPTGVSAQAGERRSQVENKRVAIRRLRLALAVQHRCLPPVATKRAGKDLTAFLEALDAPIGSVLWQSRVRSGRISCNPEHHDYPALLAEALDWIADATWDERRAAKRLGLTASQLVRFVKDCPEAMQAWNLIRKQKGLHPLR